MSTEAEELLGQLVKKIELLELNFAIEAKEKKALKNKVDSLRHMIEKIYKQNYKLFKENKKLQKKLGV